jgi:hypothetical protein
VVKIAGIFAMTYPTLFMNASAAIAKFAAATSLYAVSMACRRAGSPSVGQHTTRVCFPPSRLHAPVSQGDFAISRRTVMK